MDDTEIGQMFISSGEVFFFFIGIEDLGLNFNLHLGAPRKEGGAEGCHGDAQNANDNLFDDGEGEIDKSESRGDDPNVNDSDGSKDHSPQDGDGHGYQGSKDLVNPQLGLTEDHKGQPPNPVKALSSPGFSQDVIEIEINQHVDIIAVPISQIEVFGDEINAIRSLFFLLFGFLFLFLLSFLARFVFFLLLFLHLDLLLLGRFSTLLDVVQKRHVGFVEVGFGAAFRIGHNLQSR